mgnify:CR=1 FL=1
MVSKIISLNFVTKYIFIVDTHQTNAFLFKLIFRAGICFDFHSSRFGFGFDFKEQIKCTDAYRQRVLKSESEFKTIVEGVKLAELLVNVPLIRFVLLD